MPTLGRVKGWQGRLHHQGYKIDQLRQVDEVRVQRAFNLQASNAGISKDVIALALSGMNEAIEAGLSYSAVLAIGWALTKNDTETVEKIIGEELPELTDELEAAAAKIAAEEAAETAATDAAKEADRQPDILPVTETPVVAEKPAKPAASKTKQPAKKADKKAANKAETQPAKEPAKPAEPIPEITPADLAAVEVENPYDDILGVE